MIRPYHAWHVSQEYYRVMREKKRLQLLFMGETVQRTHKHFLALLNQELKPMMSPKHESIS